VLVHLDVGRAPAYTHATIDVERCCSAANC
jgi:hypothetical protein